MIECYLRHPRDCRYVTNNKKCKFGGLCAFNHQSGGTTAKESEINNVEESVRMLKQMIDEKDKEIANLKDLLKKTQISQIDGEDFIDDFESSSEMETLSQGLSESEVELFFCDLCNFNTEHKKGLKIHFSKMHKKKCYCCGIIFENKDNLERHEILNLHLLKR